MKKGVDVHFAFVAHCVDLHNVLLLKPNFYELKYLHICKDIQLKEVSCDICALVMQFAK